jgi:hypothetical protein
VERTATTSRDGRIPHSARAGDGGIEWLRRSGRGVSADLPWSRVASNPSKDAHRSSVFRFPVPPVSAVAVVAAEVRNREPELEELAVVVRVQSTSRMAETLDGSRSRPSPTSRAPRTDRQEVEPGVPVATLLGRRHPGLSCVAPDGRHTRAARESMCELGYPPEWAEALTAYLPRFARENPHVDRRVQRRGHPPRLSASPRRVPARGRSGRVWTRTPNAEAPWIRERTRPISSSSREVRQRLGPVSARRPLGPVGPAAHVLPIGARRLNRAPYYPASMDSLVNEELERPHPEFGTEFGARAIHGFQ